MRQSAFAFLIAILLAAPACEPPPPEPPEKEAAPAKDTAPPDAPDIPEAEATVIDEGKQWILRHDGGDFEVRFPVGYLEPKAQRQAQNTSDGKFTFRMYLAKTATNDRTCMFGWNTYPGRELHRAHAPTLLSQSVFNARREMEGEIVEEIDFTYRGHPGRRAWIFKEDGEEPTYTRYEYLIVPPRLFQMGYLAKSREAIDAPEVDLYFNSFVLNETE